MKEKLFSIMGLSFLLAAFALAVVPAQAQNIDDKIQALEQELSQLKTSQLELKKEATAAAAALPNFTYRPGDGVWIEAADRAWAVNLTYELEMASYNMIHGNPHRGAPHGDIFFRRNRPYMRFALNDGFYDFTIGWDMDTVDMVRPNIVLCNTTSTSGTATSACNSTSTTTNIRPNNAAMQSQSMKIHFEKINPYFPRFEIGDNIGSYSNSVGFPGVKGGNQGTITDEQITDLLSDSGASELGRRAIQLAWVQIPVGPGDFTYGIEYKPGASVSDVNTGTINLATTDRRQLQTAIQLRPFSRSKNPWLERAIYAFGIQTDSIDPRDTGNRNLQLTTFEREGRLTLFSAGSNIGRGTHNRIESALQWGVGPYQLTGEWGFSKYASGKGRKTAPTSNPGAAQVVTVDGTLSDCCHGVQGYYWGVTHDIFVWGPKGFLTGDRSTFGSVLTGFAFQKATASCGSPGPGTPSLTGCATIHRNTLSVREWGLYYYLWRGARLGVNYTWYRADNTPTAAQITTGCSRNSRATDNSKSCNIQAVTMILHTNF